MKPTLISRLALACNVCALVCCGLALTGCDGSSSSSSSASSVSRFAGNYAGTFTDTGQMQTGTLSSTITSTGGFSGTIVNNTVVASAALSGSIDSNGNLNFTYTIAPNTYTGTGTLAFNAQNHLVGNIQTKQNSTLLGTSAVDLAKQ